MNRSKKEKDIKKKIQQIFRDVGLVEKVTVINMLECSISHTDIIKRIYDELHNEYNNSK